MRLFRVASIAAVSAALLVVGCSRTPEFVAKEEPWRADEERSCLASGMVRQSPYLVTRSALGGPGDYCGALSPFEMSAANYGRVQMRPAAMLRCPMVPHVDRWVADVIEPAARTYFGMGLVELKVAASYSCRPINGVAGNKLSEHGHANALDISGFVLADGRTITVKGGWNGSEAERQFLRAVHRGACVQFTTVLGPLANAYHHDHFHVDLARHGRDGTHRVCE